MALTITYDGGALGYDVAPDLVNLPTRAENGEVSFGSIPVEDPEAAATFVGHQPVTVEESACTSQPRLFTGYVALRDIGRSYEHTQWGDADARLHDMTIVDCNAAAGFRVIWDTDGNRPEETWDERLAWITGSDYLSPLIGGDDTFWDSHINPMDAADYRGSFPQDVLNDLVQRFDGAMNWFLFYNPDTDAVELAIFGIDDTIGAATLTISNDATDIDGATCFAPDMVTRLAREPDQVYSEVIVQYANGGQVYRSRAETAAAYIRRGTTISRPYTGKASTAIAQADQWLDSHAVERDRITCTIQSVPRVSAGLVRAGQQMMVRFTHLPGHEGFHWMRVVAVTPTPTNGIGDYYDIALELVGAAPSESEETYAALTYHHSFFYGCEDHTLYNGDGSEVVGWHEDLETQSTYCTAEPKRGYVDYESYGGDSACVYRGFRLTADATVDIYMTGRFTGVSNGAAWYHVALRQNGTIIHEQTITDTYGSLHAWGGIFSFNIFDFEATDGDLFDISADEGGWAGFQSFAAIPGDNCSLTKFTITGLGGVPKTGDTTKPPRPTTVSTTTDPTADDDEADGYGVGTIWVNTSTGEAWVLTDATEGAAVWEMITAPAEPEVADLDIVLNGGGLAITAGVKAFVYFPFAATITAARLLADQTGSIVVDIWKDTYANHPPTNDDSITASAPPTISSAIKSADTTLTGWTKAIAAGDILAINVDSCTAITLATLALTFEKG